MFSEAKARRVTQFIECLKHTKGEFHGEPFKLLPWQEKIIRDVFGTVRDDDPSMRQYNTAYIEIPKKNGKMTISGSRKKTCLVSDMITPSLAFPMEVKNPADIGWIPLAKVISMKIRRYFSAN